MKTISDRFHFGLVLTPTICVLSSLNDIQRLSDGPKAGGSPPVRFFLRTQTHSTSWPGKFIFTAETQSAQRT
jgi:hypothetical protein